MHTILINAPHYAGRREFQKRQFERLDLRMELLNAVSFDNVPDSLVKSAARNSVRPVSLKDLACFMSHRLAWEKVAAEQSHCMVAEDDIVLSDRTPAVLRFIEELKPLEYDIFDLEYVPRNHFFARQALHDHPHAGTATEILQNKHGLGSYVLGPAAAARLLDETEEFRLVDAFVWTRHWPRFIQIEPAVGVQMQHFSEFPELASESVDAQNATIPVRNPLTANLNVLRSKSEQARAFLKAISMGERRRPRVDRSEFAMGDLIT